MTEMPEIRERIRGAVSSLYELDDQLAALAESLVLPPDAGEMWDLQIPMSFTPNLYAALGAVRTDCIQDAAVTLLHAVRQTNASLLHEWELGRAGQADLDDASLLREWELGRARQHPGFDQDDLDEKDGLDHLKVDAQVGDQGGA